MLIQNLKVISHDSMEGRFFSTIGNLRTRKFLVNQFKILGLKPVIEKEYVQEFDSNLSNDSIKGGNILAMIPGQTEKMIVITAHFDHLGMDNGRIFNGADDNASGTSALLTMASYFKDKSLKHTLIFAATDGEELGSLGCEYLLNNFPKNIDDIDLNINMDMISRNRHDELYASGLYHNPGLTGYLDKINTEINLEYGNDDPNDLNGEDWTFSSDHQEFFKRKIPYIYFGVENHEDYHMPTDTFDRIDPGFYTEAVRLIIQVVENCDKIGD